MGFLAGSAGLHAGLEKGLRTGDLFLRNLDLRRKPRGMLDTQVDRSIDLIDTYIDRFASVGVFTDK